MEQIGHNQPDLTTTIRETADALSDWMKERPVISSEADAREAKILIDRAALTIADSEDERKAKVSPLNQQVNEINSYYRKPRELLQRVCDELKYRLTSFLAREEAQRIAIADAAKRLSDSLREAAIAAERAEKDALNEAATAGTCDVDVVGVTESADRAFEAYQKADRQAQIAEKDAHVRLGGGFRRALSLRNKEEIVVVDLIAAVTAMQQSDRIIEAVIKAARNYHKIFGKYPPGVEIKITREI